MSYKNLLTLPSVFNRNAYASLDSLNDLMNELVGSFPSDLQARQPSVRGLAKFPAINVSENDQTIRVRAELPAMQESDIKIDVTKNRLTLSGEKKHELEEGSGTTYHMCELSYGKFSRTLTLPFEIDANAVKAEFKDGVLDISVQKPSQEIGESKSIPIGIGG